MDATETGRSSLNIQRFRAQYLVSSEHPSPKSLRARLDEVYVKSLPRAISTILSRSISPADSTIWFIRRLELKADMNAAWNREQVSKCWATEIARKLASTIHEGEDGQNVVRFDDRVAYLAQFLVDLAGGHAWGKWYYMDFDGLSVLPVSAALRTAICDQPTTGLAAMLQLGANQRFNVIQMLTAQDARRVLQSIADYGHVADEMRCFQKLWDVWPATDLGPLQAEEEWRNALRLYLGVCENNSELSGRTLKAAALALLRLARCLANSSPTQGKKILTVLSAGDLPGLYVTAGSASAEIMVPLVRCPSDWVRDVGQALLSHHSDEIVHEPAAATNLRYTAFGGIFLLLPFLDTLPLEQATHGWPDPEETPTVALLRFLILVKCCGQSRAQRVVFDTLVRDLMGVDPSLSLAEVTCWHSRISQGHLETFLEKMATWQKACGAVDGQTLVLASIPLTGGPVAVLLDCQRGVWLFVGGYHPRRSQYLIERLSSMISLEDQKSAALITEDVFVEPLSSAFPDILVLERQSNSVIDMASEDKGIAETLARLDKLRSDISYLAMPKRFGVNRSFDLAISVAAENLMRSFAWRLPGFAGSSLPYLYANFLDFTGSLEDEPERRVVRLGRPPLQLVVNMTGMGRQTYQLSWLDQRPFALFQEE